MCQYIGEIPTECGDGVIEAVVYRSRDDTLDIMPNIRKPDKLQEMNVHQMSVEFHLISKSSLCM